MKAKKIPMRRCVGCMESKPKREMIRIVASPEGPRLDPTGKANGRGIYLCSDEECWAKAKKRKAIGRGLEIETTERQMEVLIEELAKYEKKN